MRTILDNPVIVFAVSLVTLLLFEWLTSSRFVKLRAHLEQVREDFRLIQGATLTLLALIIGFTFSMAAERYSQRKNYEEAEANAIGTEYVRADLLPPADAEKVRKLLLSYMEQRILFYTTHDVQKTGQINAETMRLQSALWSAVVGPSLANPTQVMALVTAGMNDVLNSQGYTQAAWLNRIPEAAWVFMFAIAICSVMLVGIGGTGGKGNAYIVPILPIVVSIAFFLIADIDSPLRGVIRVTPQNLLILAESLRTP
ncbi:MAG TPA: hypothetical protein VKF40_24880 [Burkholderiales bacterium]|nr:hypothetical protein [Burkholderiales bacterium]